MPGAISAENGKIDFFISRAGAEADFAAVIGSILEKAGHRVHLQQWDFTNRNFMERMHSALDSGARVIALLSPTYFKSDHCMAEALNTIGHDPLNKEARLIVMRIAEYAPGGLFTALAYWDLVPLRDNAIRLREIVLQAVDRNTPRIAPSSFFITPKIVLHDRIRAAPNFTGRRVDLEALDRALWNGKTAVITQAVVQGLGGVGKSTLAIQYAWENRERYAGACWLGADTQAGIVDGLVALGAIFIPGLNEAKDRAEAARTALNFIAEGGFAKPWLLLYDNVEQPKTLDGLLPRAGAHALITTRFPDWKGRAVAVPLGVFADEEAVQFLLGRTGRSDKEGADRLARDLGKLPLALDHAAAYCKRTGTSFDKYREFLPELIKRAPKDADYPRNVYATFSLAMEHAAADCPEAETLMGLAYFAPDDIPLSLITADAMSEIARGDAVQALCEVSLLEVENEGDQPTVSVHRLTQTVMRDRLAKQGKAEEAAETALTLVADAFPVGDGDKDPSDVRSWPVCTTLRSHAISVMGSAPDSGETAEKTSLLPNQLALYFLARAEHGEAEPLMRRVISIFEKNEPEKQPNYASSLNNLAALLQATNRLAESEPLMRRALAIDEKSFGPDHPSVARNLNNLALLLQATNRLAESEPLMRRALAIDEKALGPDHPNVATCLNNLALLLQATNRLAEAEPLMRRARSPLTSKASAPITRTSPTASTIWRGSCKPRTGSPRPTR
jgi:tetratricopeptide (TPR) repeat protein